MTNVVETRQMAMLISGARFLIISSSFIAGCLHLFIRSLYVSGAAN